MIPDHTPSRGELFLATTPLGRDSPIAFVGVPVRNSH